MDRESYEKYLKRKQKQHLESIQQAKEINWQPCLHDGCLQCHGTGRKLDGSMCVHSISCPCPKCTPYC